MDNAISPRLDRASTRLPHLRMAAFVAAAALCTGAIVISTRSWTLAVLAPGALLFYLTAIRWPAAVTMILLLFDATIAQLLKIYRPDSATIPAVSDALALILLIALASRYGIPRLRSFLDVHIAFFVGFVLIVALLNPLAPHGLQLVAGVRTLALYLPMYFYGRRLLETTSSRRSLYTVAAGLAIVLGCISVIQDIQGPTWALNHHLLAKFVHDWISSAGGLRPSSLLPTPGVAGVLFGALAIMALSTFAVPGYASPPISRRLAAMAIVMAVTGLILSGERASVVGLAAGALVTVAFGRSRPLLGAVLLVSGCLMLAAALAPGALAAHRFSNVTSPRSANSFGVRYTRWSYVLRQLPSYPLGHGPGYTGSAATRYGGGSSSIGTVTPDNYWVKLLWEVGVLGPLWYTIFLLTAIVTAFRRLRGSLAITTDSVVYLTLLGLLTQQAVTAEFTNILDPLPYALLFWLLVGYLRPFESYGRPELSEWSG